MMHDLGIIHNRQKSCKVGSSTISSRTVILEDILRKKWYLCNQTGLVVQSSFIIILIKRRYTYTWSFLVQCNGKVFSRVCINIIKNKMTDDDKSIIFFDTGFRVQPHTQ